MNKIIITLITIIEYFFIFIFYDKSPDYNNYIHLILNVWPNFELNESIMSDYLFIVISNLFSSIGGSPTTIIICISLFSISIKNFIFSKLRFGVYASFLYLSSLFWTYELIQIRTGLATSFILLSWFFFSLKENKISLIYAIAGILSHMASLALISLYFIRGINRKYLLIIIIISILVFSIFNNIIPDILNYIEFERVGRYLSRDLFDGSDVGLLNSISIISVLTIVLIYKRKSYLPSGLSIIFISPFMLILSMAIGYSIPVLAIRFSQEFFLPVILLFSWILSKENGIGFNFIYLFCCMLCIYSFPFKLFL